WDDIAHINPSIAQQMHLLHAVVGKQDGGLVAQEQVHRLVGLGVEGQRVAAQLDQVVCDGFGALGGDVKGVGRPMASAASEKLCVPAL
ncbi:MAG: hypothetical protein QG554_1775, partial [Pseudomonadota bacterium]|nr:hypothetical protein [Pseudomonadota bacterium]